MFCSLQLSLWGFPINFEVAQVISEIVDLFWKSSGDFGLGLGVRVAGVTSVATGLNSVTAEL